MKKININNLTGNLNFSFNFKSNHATSNDNTYNQLVEKVKPEIINEYYDSEKITINPTKNNLIFRLKNNIGSPLTYSNLGFTNDDIKFRRNKFKNSFLRIDYFDKKQVTNQKLLFQSIVYVQLNEDQTDVNSLPLDVSVMPVTFRIKNPKIKLNSNVNSSGYYIFLKKTEIDLLENIYATFSLNLANTGESKQLISRAIPLNFNEFNIKKYVTYNIYKNNDIYFYQVVNTNDNQVITLSNEMQIDLYEPIFN